MEVGLAATVLALTLTGMIGVVESGSQMLDLSRKQTLAAQILHSEIDQLRLQSWMAVAGEPAGGTGFVHQASVRQPRWATAAPQHFFRLPGTDIQWGPPP